jgi:hypothetical protein
MKKSIIKKYELETFLNKCKAVKVEASINGGKSNGIYVRDLLDAGISKGTISILKSLHYIQVKSDDLPIWIGYSNKFYPSRCIANLEKIAKVFDNYDDNYEISMH